MPRAGPDFTPLGRGVWRARFARPEVNRFEYRFELSWPGSGKRELILDPENPKMAPGAFGARSVIEFPEYETPDWISNDPPAGNVATLTLPSARLGGDQTCLLWSSHDSSAGTALPLLIALDGLEFDSFSDLLRFLDVMIDRQAIPPMRALLMRPTKRDDHYSANPIFPLALSEEIIPAVDQLAPIRRSGGVGGSRGGGAGRPELAGLGASLGGLALLHAQRRMESGFTALFLQSSTFLHHGYLLGFTHFRRVENFLDDVLVGRSQPANGANIELTCGTVEFSLENNWAVAAALESQGNPTGMHVLRDAHNWIGWRDAWDPHLVRLLGESFG